MVNDMKASFAPLVGVLLTPLLASGCGSSSPGPWVVISKETGSGRQNVYAQGTAHNPSSLGVQVGAKPNVKVQVGYAVNCGNGFDPTKGQIPGTPTIAPIPLPHGNPESCFVEVVARESGIAPVTITIFAR
jgi:hypothetical protein